MSLTRFADRWIYVWFLVLLASLTFSPALMEISTCAMLGGWFLLRFKKEPLLLIDRKIILFLCAFVFLSVISFFWSDFPRQSFRGIFKVLQQFFIFLVAAEILNSNARHQKVLQVLIFCFLYLALDGIWQYIFGHDLVRRISFEPASSGPRISASFRNYGLLASFLITFLPLVTTQLRKKKGLKETICPAIAVVFGVLLLFWTRLRGAWIAFLAGLLFYVWNSKKRIYVLLLGIAVTIGLFLLPRSMMIHLDAEGKEQSLIERFYLWDRAVQVIEARPWTGTGINTYSVAHQQFDHRKNWRVKNYYSHNGYLQLAAETGLPSLGCFLAFIFFYFLKSSQVVKLTKTEEERQTLLSFLVGMVNFLVLALIDTIFHNPQAVMGFWLLAGWGIAYQNLALANQGVSCRKD